MIYADFNNNIEIKINALSITIVTIFNLICSNVHELLIR